MSNKVNAFADLGQLLKDSPEQNTLQQDVDLYNKDIKILMKELSVNARCASDILYLRTRHRHTQILEDDLIALHKAGTLPNMNEFGCTKETGEALLNAALTSVASKYSPQPDAY